MLVRPPFPAIAAIAITRLITVMSIFGSGRPSHSATKTLSRLSPPASTGTIGTLPNLKNPVSRFSHTAGDEKKTARIIKKISTNASLNVITAFIELYTFPPTVSGISNATNSPQETAL